MKAKPPAVFSVRILAWLLIFSAFSLQASPPALDSTHVPAPLKSWIDWVRWNPDFGLEKVPGSYQDPHKRLKIWPATLDLNVQKEDATFSFQVALYAQSWVGLPGGPDQWPSTVRVDGEPVPVLEQAGRPSVQIAVGSHKIEGAFHWKRTPRTLSIPPEIGLLTLSINGKAVENASWDAQGLLWLEHDRAPDPEAPAFVEVKVYRVLEDGIPLWLRTDLELTISGKSREIELGGLLPEGWQLASIEGPLPVAVDSAGKVKVQGRAGKWTLHAEAFLIQSPKVIGFSPNIKPLASEEFIAFKANPEFRVLELSGLAVVDVSQTTVPNKWRELPVYRWITATPFQLTERMRGMGQPQTEGLSLSRQLWLDETGGGLTFRDQLTGRLQTLWRLDVVDRLQLGAVRSGESGLLLTKNPVTGATGVELRERTVDLDATGRLSGTSSVPASGWSSGSSAVKVTLHLPPGWRLLALFGADYVRGDWLTAWTLLDLFVVLVFSMGISRIFGRRAGVLAFFALVLSYLEPEAPRYSWLGLLVSVALLRTVAEGWAKRLAKVLRVVAAGCLFLILIPFVANQLQEALHPQLETTPRLGSDTSFVPGEMQMQGEVAHSKSKMEIKGASSLRLHEPAADKLQGYLRKGNAASDNLAYDIKARIQTGPPIPEWTWRQANYGWNGPVTVGQNVRMVLLSRGMVGVLTVLRVVLLLALSGLLLNLYSWNSRWLGKTAALLLLAGALLHPLQAVEPIGLPLPQDSAEISPQISATVGFPDKEMLQLLRQRLEPSVEIYPNAADIPFASLVIENRKLTMEADVHLAVAAAVPLPGKLAAWSPVRVLVDGKPEAVLRREDGFLWIVLSEGIHRVRVEGMLVETAEWEWAFQLRPRRVEISAPEWTVSGVRANGVPEQQVFLRLKEKTKVATGYERQEYAAALVVERHLELGLSWQVRTTVRRLSPEGRAVSVRVPLLAGERVLTPNFSLAEGFVDVRLGARDQALTWDSELPVSARLKIASRADDKWVEQWRVVASPVWNVGLSGPPPVYRAQEQKLVPEWNPWPGESLELAVSRAEALQGETVTVSHVRHEVVPGQRQRTAKVELTVRSSLGEEFILRMPPEAEVISLQINQKERPVRMEAGRLIVSLQPGAQTIRVDWRSAEPLTSVARVGAVVLPAASANVTTTLQIPTDRWVLWTYGPLRGPAVRFWTILLCSALAGWALGGIGISPLSRKEWSLLCIGLTQVPLPAGLTVVGWLMCLAIRGREPYAGVRAWVYNALQISLIFLSIAALGTLGAAVAQGLLGRPEMFIAGNGSTPAMLDWYQARSGKELPQPGCILVSLWWYRLAMLLWALWLAGAVLAWLRKGWEQFCAGGGLRRG